ncbi:MAG: DoxX family protein [Paludibacteraceae bacterium]|nr:DoxX family protein [Paludibacteraceae bacterium]
MIKRVLLIIFRLLLGCVFVFSGFVKTIDPLGFTYKIQDYLSAMGPFISNFSSVAFIAAVTLSALELLVGLNFILGARLKETTWVAALFLLFMTPLTFWIAIKNPVHDCGCFGDALIISNWATFWKNIVLSALVVSVFLLRKSHKPFVGHHVQWALALYGFLFAIGLSTYCYYHLPLVDFRPYKIGSNIAKGMEIPANAASDSFDIKLIYAKNGVEKEFTLQNYPKNDNSWTFVDQKSVLVKKGYEPPIHDFTMETDHGDITNDVLSNPGYTFLLISYDLKKTNIAKSNKINDIYHYAKKHGYGFYAMTASTDDDIATYKKQAKAEYPIVLTDKITLKTIIRSNPGLVLIKGATVYNMWSVYDLPRFKEPLEKSALGTIEKPDAKNTIAIVAILFLVPVFITFLIDTFLTNRRD